MESSKGILEKHITMGFVLKALSVILSTLTVLGSIAFFIYGNHYRSLEALKLAEKNEIRIQELAKEYNNHIINLHFRNDIFSFENEIGDE